MALHTDHKWPAYGNNWLKRSTRPWSAQWHTRPLGQWHTTAYINFSVILKQNDSVIFVSLAKKIIFLQIKPFFLETLVYAGLRWFMICSNLRLGKALKGQMVEMEVNKGSRMCEFLCMFISLLYLYVNVLLMYLQVCFYLHLTQLLMWPN